MSHYLYDGTDPDKRAEAMAKVAETIAANGQPLWRPGGGTSKAGRPLRVLMGDSLGNAGYEVTRCSLVHTGPT